MSDYPPHGPMPADGPKVVPAATVVIFRRSRDGGPPELLMVQRAEEMRFAGGAAVFPGGRVDPADRELAARILPDEDPEVAAARIAGIRETLEETGLMIATSAPVSAQDAAAARAMLLEVGALAPVLDRFGWDLDPRRLVLFAHWCPPHDKAFDTRFFVTDLGTGAVDVTIDATENTRLFWASAARALELADAGEISVIFPTRRNLDRLALFGSFDEALAQIARHPVRRIHANPEPRDGEDWLMIPDGHGYPVLGQPMRTVRRG
ncbi:NUDIX hydrolase [Novosphingobium album (ex Liu et al. 2023)]|uniref:NUDIX domain-containing protein n=1 Tax=Novosphingobium album (ex Liu et al. 2023) TaxID=3031130 RepID=A0ABT5WSS5_9SPHN|nr:NUDIX domain-containing protein [Novosphingobium album (ex Liu et al. 2023)]MDE8653094.1 NUDIX domain-containing protein [Novosphingobium album (ex Liu et al. 2023)]